MARKKATRTKLTTKAVADPKFTNLDPNFVYNRLVDYRNILLQDIHTLRMSRGTANHNLAHFPEFKSIGDYLRSFLLIFMTSSKSTPQDATPAAWHPYILEYCRKLGVDPSDVDSIFERIVSGDLSDDRVCESQSDAAIQQLETAMSRAREQWIAGKSAISKVADPEQVIYLPLESRILDALSFKAMKVEALAYAVGFEGSSALYKTPWRNDPSKHVLAYMVAQKWIAHNRKMGGYYRPSHPPAVGQPKNPPSGSKSD